MLTHAKQGSDDFSKSVRSFGNALGAFNSFLNELAYKPKGSRQSYLFYLPWLNHNTNATFNLNDPAGPISRGLVMISCNGTEPRLRLRDRQARTSKTAAARRQRPAQGPTAADRLRPKDSHGHGCGPGTE